MSLATDASTSDMAYSFEAGNEAYKVTKDLWHDFGLGTSNAEDSGKSSSLADIIREAANDVLRERYLKNFEFDEKSQLYYNSHSGYYYDQNAHLFYHPSTRCYYYYDEEAEAYCYHSRLPSAHIWSDKSAEWRARLMFGPDYECGMSQNDVDVFECLESIVRRIVKSFYGHGEEMNSGEIETMIEEERIDYAPCVRLVQSSENVKLHVITITGATIGSSENCDIRVLNENVVQPSVCASISYESSSMCYFVTLSSDEHKFFINNVSLEKTKPYVLEHGDVWQLNGETFLVHIHHGSNTCGACEPGLYSVAFATPTIPSTSQSISSEAQRRRNLRNMKKQYGIYDDNESISKVSSRRRERKADSVANAGFCSKEASIYSNCEAKPLPSCSTESVVLRSKEVITSALDKSNKGFKMMVRMGWKEGAGLGRNEEGIIEPIRSKAIPNRAGLGLMPKNKGTSGVKKEFSKKQHLLEITKERYERANLNP